MWTLIMLIAKSNICHADVILLFIFFSAAIIWQFLDKLIYMEFFKFIFLIKNEYMDMIIKCLLAWSPFGNDNRVFQTFQQIRIF